MRVNSSVAPGKPWGSPGAPSAPIARRSGFAQPAPWPCTTWPRCSSSAAPPRRRTVSSPACWRATVVSTSPGRRSARCGWPSAMPRPRGARSASRSTSTRETPRPAPGSPRSRGHAARSVRRARPTRGSAVQHPAGPVVSLAGRLGGEPGRVLVEAVRALRRWPQLVVCDRPESAEERQALAVLEATGVEVRVASSVRALRRLVHDALPACVITHWADPDRFSRCFRVGDEPWIVVGHLPLPMPDGYDAYVVGSAFQTGSRRMRHEGDEWASRAGVTSGNSRAHGGGLPRRSPSRC